jgi:hypothetical protein
MPCFPVNGNRADQETFAQPLFTASHELFDPSMGLLTKSQKLGLTASNSLQFAHQGGPFPSPGWAPKKVHNGRLKWLCKALVKWSFLLTLYFW